MVFITFFHQHTYYLLAKFIYIYICVCVCVYSVLESFQNRMLCKAGSAIIYSNIFRPLWDGDLLHTLPSMTMKYVIKIFSYFWSKCFRSIRKFWRHVSLWLKAWWYVFHAYISKHKIVARELNYFFRSCLGSIPSSAVKPLYSKIDSTDQQKHRIDNHQFPRGPCVLTQPGCRDRRKFEF